MPAPWGLLASSQEEAFISAGHLDNLIIICTRQINEHFHAAEASID